MDRMIYTAMSGAKQTMDQQAVVNHNMANLSTPGFRAQLDAMQTVQVIGEGMPTRSMAMATTPGSSFEAGPVTATGRDLDVALHDNAWLAVQAADGTEGYTRRGDLQVDASGMIVVAGNPVIGENGPMIVPIDSEVSIGSDGTVSVLGRDQTPENIASVGRIKLVTASAGQLERGEDGLFRAVPGVNGAAAPLPADESARLTAGALEGSNVTPTDAMLAMINNSRRYELQMKVISTADQNAQVANSLLSLS